MRRQLALAAAAIATMIVLAFLVPLALLVRSIAQDRALNATERSASALAPVLATVDNADAAGVVDQLNASGIGDVTVVFGDGATVGTPVDLGDPAIADALSLARGGKAFSTGAPGGTQVLVPVVVPNGPTDVIRVFVPEALLTKGVRSAWLLLGILALALIAVAVAVADRLGRSVVGPMGELADAAERLGQGDLDVRVEPAGPPEVVETGQTLNRLAGRITALLAAEREAAADLSHRLRTPVTALRLDVDGLHDPTERERLGADVDALTRAVDRLITEARRPMREGVRARSDLTATTAERVAFWAALAEDQDRTYAADLPAEPCLVGVGRDDLAAVLDALLGNVLSHTDEGTGFRVTVVPVDHGGGRLIVDDSGPGFPVERDVSVRGESGGGSTGLGLDIVRGAAEASGGRLTLQRSATGGARVVVDFGPPAP